MKIIWHWLILSAIVYGLTYFLPGDIVVDQWYTFIVVGAVLMFIRMIIDPIINVLAIPLNLFTLGIFSVLINGIIFWLLPYVISGFHVSDFKTALIGSIVIAFGDWFLGKVIR